MIIETARERICLSGALRVNQWPAIRTVVYFLLATHPDGVVIDCAALRNVSPAGERTFVDAVDEIEEVALPVMIAHLPGALESELTRATGGRLRQHITASFEAIRIQQAITSPEWWDRLWGVTDSGN